MNLEDVKKLADMARIEMTDDEMKEIALDFEPILSYVGQVKEAVSILNNENSEQNSENYSLKNVIRDDVTTNESGEYTEKILKNSPDVQNGYLKVKQIL